MKRPSDSPIQPSKNRCEAGGEAAAPLRPRVLVVNTDRALLGLIEEWMGTCGCIVVPDEERAAASTGTDPFALVIVDVPNPRHGGVELLQRVARDHPLTPLVALSSTFFPGIASTGAVARTLGVACVLPKPVGRESLINAVKSLLKR
jgi:DNA-binding response OmpR family regulator